MEVLRDLISKTINFESIAKTVDIELADDL